MLSACVAAVAAVAVVRPAAAQVANEPRVQVAADGSVEASVTVSASEAELLAVLSDPVRAGRLATSVIRVEVLHQGPCDRLRTLSKGLLRPISYTTLRCPTGSGIRESLIESADFDLYQSEWHLTPRGRATEVVYRMKLQLSFPAPRGLVDRKVERSVREALIALQLSVTR